MPRHEQIPDLVHDSKIETSVSGSRTEHVFYEPGRTPQERQKRRVECWERDGVLGKGAYGIVFRERRRAHSSNTEHAFRAVKKISKYVVEGESLDYMRELEAITKFSHRNYSHCFVRSDGWFEMGDSIFIAMEYIEHGDLQKNLVQPLPEVEARQIIGQVLEGLQYMHENGFVHRDLKPGNIMVVNRGPDWFVKIADFGISKRRQKGVTTLHTLQRGTLGFVAPEVLGINTHEKQGSYTFAVDIWSLGAVAYYIMTKEIVFDNAGGTFMYAVGMSKFPVEVLKNNRASAEVQSFIMNLMATKPEDRPSAAAAKAHEWLASTLTLKPHTASTDMKTLETLHETSFTSISTASAEWSDGYDSWDGTSPGYENNEDDSQDDNDETDSESDENTDVENLETQSMKTVTPPRSYQPPSVEDAIDDSNLNLLPVLPTDAPFVLEDEEKAQAALDQHEEDAEAHAGKSIAGQEKFRRAQEKAGRVRRLHRVGDVVPTPELWELRGVKQELRICFACKRHVLASSPGITAPCGHWHCLQCISWASRNSKVNTPQIPPRCCSKRVPFIVPPESGLSIESCSNTERHSLVRCQDDTCRRRFEPLYVVTDTDTWMWVVNCPRCGTKLCYECVQNPGASQHSIHQEHLGISGSKDEKQQPPSKKPHSQNGRASDNRGQASSSTTSKHAKSKSGLNSSSPVYFSVNTAEPPRPRRSMVEKYTRKENAVEEYGRKARALNPTLSPEGTAKPRKSRRTSRHGYAPKAKVEGHQERSSKAQSRQDKDDQAPPFQDSRSKASGTKSQKGFKGLFDFIRKPTKG